MPELPEVETVKIGLKRLILGKVVEDVVFDWPKSFPNSSQDVKKFLFAAKVIAVRRRAKVLMIDLSSAYSLVCHLKMTGQLVFVGAKRFGAGHPSQSLVGGLPDKSTRVTITFSDQTKLFFNDQRKFGWMRLLPTAQITELDFFKKVGPEPLDSSFTPLVFTAQLNKRKNRTIKAALLDQTVIAGVGNIYADESLWGAKIHPATLVRELSATSRSVLFEELLFVLRLAIKKGGSTDRNYRNAEGKKGSYMSFARVFRREGQGCPRCSSEIQKTRVASRGTHFCPKCQKVKT
jgi:formamidopyrimidine-DNA glycosylase